ncbi:hypothetical protein [Flavobacterium sp. LB2P74]|uniref:hypothetical protein n=1 Tax=Flavobacterium sp. LB2P74 TaxID=3401717 RepID=UPI003AADC898
MKVTTQQIEQLYLFTRQHYVEYYDLQTELVDHLANAIETEWQQNPKLTFDEVLNKEFRKFGVFGFMGVVEQKQKFLGKRYNKLIWNYYREYLRLPKILVTVGMVYILYSLSKLFADTEILYLILYGLVFLISFAKIYKSYKILKERNKKTDKKWLLEQTANSHNFILLMVFFNFANSYNILRPDSWGNLDSFLFPTLLILFSIFIYVKLKIIPQRISEELKQTYPEYKLENL